MLLVIDGNLTIRKSEVSFLSGMLYMFIYIYIYITKYIYTYIYISPKIKKTKQLKRQK